MIQIKAKGWTYIKSVYNFVDCSQPIIFQVFVQVQKMNIAIDYQSENQHITEIILKMVQVLSIFFKLTSYFRFNEEFGFLLKIVLKTLKKMIMFLLFFMMFTMLFSYMYFIMECEPGRDTVLYEPPSDYPGIPKFFAIFLMTFRNSIGDLAPPDYAYWILDSE